MTKKEDIKALDWPYKASAKQKKNFFRKQRSTLVSKKKN